MLPEVEVRSKAKSRERRIQLPKPSAPSSPLPPTLLQIQDSMSREKSQGDPPYHPSFSISTNGLWCPKELGSCSHLCVCVQSLSHVQLLAAAWTVARQAPLSMGFSSQEYWSGLPFPTPGDLPNPGIKPTSLVSSALAGRFFTTSATWGAPYPPLVLTIIIHCLFKPGS